MVECAWEDDAGGYHDDTAEVTGIDEKGELTLKWDKPEINEFLKGSDGYMANDVEKIS